MLRSLLLMTGGLLLFFTEFIRELPPGTQYFLLIAGILLLGIPHGAADLLVAAQNSAAANKTFSRSNFLRTYLARLAVFALLLFFFPVPGLLIFLVFAAYHFGETDLSQFNTRGITGKLLAGSYGLVLLSVLLVNKPEELKNLFTASGLEGESTALLDLLTQYHRAWLSCTLVQFFCFVFIYFLVNKSENNLSGQFLLQFALLVLLLYHLPLLLGFTFYFVIWHSVLSLQNIIRYLLAAGGHPLRAVFRQIIFFSLIAMAGIGVAGIAGYMFFSREAVLLILIGGLAVLTAPHMQVMHNMYRRLRGER